MADGSNPAVPAVGAARPPLRARSQFVLLAALSLLVLGVVMSARLIRPRTGTLLLFGLSVAFGLVVLRSLWRLGRAALRAGPTAPWTWAGLVIAGLMAVAGGMLTLLLAALFSRGRQLRRFRTVLLPRVGRDREWSALAQAPDPDPALRARLAAQWRENGRTEHASVAAFARLQLDLVALGAPPALLAGASRDALDEIRHAELCFSLARALDGQALGPQPFPEVRSAGALPRARGLALAQLAVSSLVDGALLEGFSARLIAQLAPICADPATAAVLRELAADEGRHAKHGWDVVRWCLEQGGAPVAGALHGAAQALPEQVVTALPEGARDGAWERWGIPGAAREAEAYLRSRAHVVERVQRLLHPAVRDAA